MRLVLDASVVVKWLMNDPQRERDTQRATAVMEGVGSGAYELVQPPHWLAEVAAVLCRLSPQTAADDLASLHLMECPIEDGEAVYRRACRLTAELQHHLFDTLYHAVALERDALLLTADAAYGRKAAALGHLCLLADFELTP